MYLTAIHENKRGTFGIFIYYYNIQTDGVKMYRQENNNILKEIKIISKIFQKKMYYKYKYIKFVINIKKIMSKMLSCNQQLNYIHIQTIFYIVLYVTTVMY